MRLRFLPPLALGLAIAAAHLTVCAPARAEDSPAQAAKEFAMGRERFNAKDYPSALPFFKRALAATQSPNAALYVGLCEVELNHPVEAFEAMTLAERGAAEKQVKDASYAHTHEVATFVLARLKKQLARVVVTVDNAPATPQIVVNGKPLPAERVGVALPIAPGTVSVVATAAGAPSVSSTVSVTAGEERAIALHFEAPRKLLGPSTSVGADAQTRSWFTPVRTAGVVVAGVGVAGLVVFAITGSMANSKYDAVKAACGDARCADHGQDSSIDSGKTLDTVANVTLAVGGAALLGGAAMIVFGGPGRENTALRVSPGFTGFQGSF